MTAERRSRSRIVLAALPLTGCSYNTFVSQEEAIKAQWAQVENQLQRRNDLIPNLVETVKGLRRSTKRASSRTSPTRDRDCWPRSRPKRRSPAANQQTQRPRPAAGGRRELPAAAEPTSSSTG